MQIASLSSELEGTQEPRATGGSPSSNPAAYSQLDEMPHVQRIHEVESSGESHMKPDPIKSNYLAIFMGFHTKSLPKVSGIRVWGCGWARWTALI